MPDFSQPDQPLILEQKKQKRKIFIYVLLALELFVLLWLKGASWAHQIQAQASLLGVHWLGLVVGWLLSIPALYLLVVFTHESGHVGGALLARFRVLSFIVSWLRITRRAAGWKACFIKPQAKLSGMVSAMPTHSRNLRSRYSLFIAGGPVANLLTGALALYMHHLLKAYHPSLVALSLAGYVLHHALSAFGWLSVVVGGLNLLPLKLTSGHTIDGKRLQQIFHGGPAMHQQLGLLHIQSLTQAGIRPREWDFAVVEQLLAHRSNTVLDCYAHIHAYSYYFDHGELESFRLHLNEALDRRKTAPVALQQYLLTQAASIAALYTHDTEQARYWLDRAQQVKPFTKEEGLFAQAAVAYAEGRLSEADEWLQAARQQINEAFIVGSREQAAEQLHDLQTRIQQAQLRLQPA